MKTIGERIRIRREQLNLSQEELARKLGYKSRSSINKIESDARNLTQSKIKAIADALETTPSYIMGWQEEQKQNDTIADVVIRLRTDDKFMEATTLLHQLDDTQMDSIIQMLKAFVK